MHGTTATIPPESPPIFAGAHEALTIDVCIPADVYIYAHFGGRAFVPCREVVLSGSFSCLQLFHYCDIACRKAWNRNKMWITVRLYVLPRAFAVTNVELAFPTC